MIGLGKENCPELREILQQPKYQCHDFISELARYNTNIGDGGKQIKWGQKQRLSIGKGSSVKIHLLWYWNEATRLGIRRVERLVQDALEKMMADRNFR